MKSERLLEEIKSKIDIVEFISDYVHLKKSGQNYKGLCPFHSEKTPSFMVSQTKQIFHCFGCGVGGDVVSFFMKHEHLTFPEAIRYMAKKAGIKITEFRVDKEISEKRERILQINEEAMKFFIKDLNNSHKALAYLKGRGINTESLEKFCLGHASDERDSLFRHMKKVGYSDSALKEAGLIVIDGNGYRDAFRRRIIFPILNLKGDIIAFGGRVMDDSLPKYINSPETEVFKKGETLFAINLAKDEIRKKDYAIIVEGYLDAIICHQYDFRNTVAPLGTALTSRHLQKLKLLTKKVVLVFDSDQAGIAAARRSLAILCENDFKAKVLLLPEGEDPDSFLRKNGSPPFKQLFSHAMSMTEFLMNTSKGDKIDIVKESLSNIALMKDMIIADELLGELADRSRIHESVLRSELEKIRKKSVLYGAEGLKTAKKVANREEYLLLSALIAFPEKAGSVLSKLNLDDLSDKTIRSVFYKIKMLSGDLNMDSLLNMADEAERTLITEFSIKPGFDLEHVDRNIDDCLQTLQQKQFEERKNLAEESGDVTLMDSLLKEKRRLTKRVTT
jgi:DNA primase